MSSVAWVVSFYSNAFDLHDTTFLRHWDGHAFTAERIGVDLGSIQDAWLAPSGEIWVGGGTTVARWDGGELTRCRLEEGGALVDVSGTPEGGVIAVAEQGVLVRE